MDDASSEQAFDRPQLDAYLGRHREGDLGVTKSCAFVYNRKSVQGSEGYVTLLFFCSTYGGLITSALYSVRKHAACGFREGSTRRQSPLLCMDAECPRNRGSASPGEGTCQRAKRPCRNLLQLSGDISQVSLKMRCGYLWVN